MIMLNILNNQFQDSSHSTADPELQSVDQRTEQWWPWPSSTLCSAVLEEDSPSSSSSRSSEAASGVWFSWSTDVCQVELVHDSWSWSLLSGMVSVCAGCDEMKPWAGLVTGIVGGCFYAVNSKIIAKLKVDDPLDAVAVHLGSGFWGLIAGPLFKYVQDCSNVSFLHDLQVWEGNNLLWLCCISGGSGLEHGRSWSIRSVAASLWYHIVWFPEGRKQT